MAADDDAPLRTRLVRKGRQTFEQGRKLGSQLGSAAGEGKAAFERFQNRDSEPFAAFDDGGGGGGGDPLAALDGDGGASDPLAQFDDDGDAGGVLDQFD